MELIALDQSLRELYPLDANVDFEIGDVDATNDFEISEAQSTESAVYIPGTEFGGLIEYEDGSSSTKSITMKGWSWRGLLTQWFIEPETGNDYKIVSGELHTVMRELLSPVLGGFFNVPETDTGVAVDAYQFKLHCSVLEGLMDLLNEYGYRLKIWAERPAPGKAVAVYCEAVMIKQIEGTYDEDTGLNLRFVNNRMGINHLICWGSGELKERQRIDLYIDADGNIGDTQYYTGFDERQGVFDYGNAESLEDLRENGAKHLKESASSKSLQIDEITDVDLGIGDIVVGRKNDMGIKIESPITRKILRISEGKESIEYKVKGES